MTEFLYSAFCFQLPPVRQWYIWALKQLSCSLKYICIMFGHLMAWPWPMPICSFHTGRRTQWVRPLYISLFTWHLSIWNLKTLCYGKTQRTWFFSSAINRYHSLLLYTSSCQATYLCEQNIWFKQLSTKKLYSCQRNNDFYFMFKEGFTDWSKFGERKTLMLKRCSWLWGKNWCNCYRLVFGSCLLKRIKTLYFLKLYFVSHIFWFTPVIDICKSICRILSEAIKYI